MLRLIANMSVCGLLWVAGLVHAQQYPAKPVYLVVGFATGSGSDVSGRALADAWSRKLPQKVIVDNRPGDAGMIAYNHVAKSAPDGYTLLFSSDALAIYPLFFKHYTLDSVKAFNCVGLTTDVPILLATGAQSPFKDMAELISYARANPSKVNYGLLGYGQYNVTLAYMAKQFDLKMVEVPYKSAADTRQAALRGDIQLYPEILITALPHVKSGTLRILTLWNDKRLPELPDVPTVNEGALAPLNLNGQATWNNVSAPAGMPRNVLVLLNRSLNEAMDSPEFVELNRRFNVAIHKSTPEECDAQVKTDVDKWAAIGRQVGIKQVD